MKESRSKTDYSNESLDCSFVGFSPLFRQLTIDELNLRKNYFKNLLYNMINKYHNEFLSKNKIEQQIGNINFNYDRGSSLRSWNSSFDLESCLEIPCFDFDFLGNKNKSAADKSQSKNTLGNFIKSHDIKNHLVSEALDKLKAKNIESSDLDADQKANKIRESKNEYFLSKYLSNETLEKVRSHMLII
jgi:hypothetical protein